MNILFTCKLVDYLKLQNNANIFNLQNNYHQTCVFLVHGSVELLSKIIFTHTIRYRAIILNTETQRNHQNTAATYTTLT